jgi:hypothetical protein
MKQIFSFVLFIFLFLFSSSVLAQKKSLPGFYISNDGDTVKGVFPYYGQWAKNPSLVQFIPSDAMEPMQLTPQNTRSFLVEGYDEYLSYSGRRLLNPIEDYALLNEQLPGGSADNYEEVATFLRLVIKTEGASLYVFYDAKRTNFFYQLPAQPIKELKYKKTYELNKIREFADYRNQLNNQFREAIERKNLMAKLQRLTYSEETLSNFFQELFSEIKFENKKPGTKAEWVVSAGMAINMFSVEAEESFKTVPKTYTSSFSPLISIGYKFPMDRNFGKYFLFPQVKFFRYKNSGEEIKGTLKPTATYHSDLLIATEVGGGVNLVNKENFKFFLSGGFGLLVQTGGLQESQILYASNNAAYGSASVTSLPTTTYSVEISAGATLHKKLLLTGAYMLPSNMGQFVYYSPRLSGVHLKLGYRFAKN